MDREACVAHFRRGAARYRHAAWTPSKAPAMKAIIIAVYQYVSVVGAPVEPPYPCPVPGRLCMASQVAHRRRPGQYRAGMRLPTFLVIGAQKSGTSWIHRFLTSRPDVCLPRNRKELMFFDHKGRFNALGIEGYAAYFTHADDAVAVGEVTPGYLFVAAPHPGGGDTTPFQTQTPERARSILGPDLKLVASLRNPVDRALSAFLHHRKKGRVPDGATIGSSWEVGKIVNIGFYGAQLARWAKAFPRRNFFVLTYDELFASRERRSALLSFIGAAPATGDELVRKRVYAGIGFTRTPDGAFDSNGALIATTEEIAALRAVYAGDVRQLGRDWS